MAPSTDCTPPRTRRRPRLSRVWLALVPLAFAFTTTLPGCAKRSGMYTEAPDASYDGEMAPAPEEAYAGSGGGDGMGGLDEPMADFEADDVDMAGEERAVFANTGSTDSRASFREESRSDKSAKLKAKPRKGKRAKKAAETEEEADKPEEYARQIIYTADMTVAVFKVDSAMKKAEALAISLGGYVQQMSEGTLILRIPAPRLREAMDAYAEYGIVNTRNLQARDVTEEYVDVRTRIRVLRETQSQLIALLKKSRNVEEALKVRQALDRTTMELEQALGRLRVLESLISFSTLTLSLVERGPHNSVPSSNDPFPWVDSLGVEATEWK